MSIKKISKPMAMAILFAIVASVLLIVLRGSTSVSRDFFTINAVSEPVSGDVIFLSGYQLNQSGKSPKTVYAKLDLKQKRIIQEQNRPWNMTGVKLATKNYTFNVEKDVLLIGPKNGIPVRHYLVDLAAKAFPKAGLPVSRYHRQCKNSMQIYGQYAGGVVFREQKRLHRGGEYSDGYFIVSPQGTVSAEIALRSMIGTLSRHRVLHLTRKGILLVAVKTKNGSRMKGIDCRTGDTLFTIR